MVEKNETQIVCLATVTAKEGKADEMVASLTPLIPICRAEEGCLRYEMNVCTENPAMLTVVEKWADQKAFDGHCNSPHVLAYWETDGPRLVEKTEIILYQELLS